MAIQPLLNIVHRLLRDSSKTEASADSIGALMATANRELNALVQERDTIRGKLCSLRRSRSKLFKALIKAIFARR